MSIVNHMNLSYCSRNLSWINTIDCSDWWINPNVHCLNPHVYPDIYIYIYIICIMCIYIYIYGKCLGFAQTCNDDRRHIIIITITIIIIIIIIITIIIIIIVIIIIITITIIIIIIIIIIITIIIIVIVIIIIVIIIIIIKPLLKIFSECRSLTEVGELRPYWWSSMNVEVSRGWEN